MPGPDSAVAPLDPAIREMLNRPVNEVLAALGLPPVPVPPQTPPQQQLPQAPKGVPEAPSVPGFDVAGLVKPMTDLLSTFGSGSFSGVDPSAALSGASKALEQGMSAGMQAVSALSQLWQGPAASAATGKGVQAATGTGLVAEQGAELSTAVSEAAAVVGQGEAELQAIIDSFMAVIAALGPSLWLPPGQIAAVTAAQEHTDHALAVVSRVKAQLSALSAQVGAAGRKVPVSQPPMAAAMAVAEVASAVVPAVVSAATGAVGAVGKMATDTVGGAVKTVAGLASSAGEAITGIMEKQSEEKDGTAGTAADTESTGKEQFPTSAVVGGGGSSGTHGGGGIGGVVGGTGAINAALAPSNPQSPIARTPMVEGGARTVPAGDVVSRNGIGGGMMPMSAAGARPSQSADHNVPEYLVTGHNGEQVVGDLPLVGPQVVGDADGASAAVDELPDVELRL